MKVKIMQRSVYHKYAEVEIEIDQKDYQKYTDADGNLIDLQDYLHEREDLWCDKLQVALDEASLDFGFGMDTGDWTDHTEESEWRYEANGNGGHL